jgi:lipopolysaccharide/colanic/teichoic acid biosynthesis glycosyltransferase
LKRLFDCIGGAVLLLLLVPLFIVIILLIKFTSRGPVLFKQRRIGLYRREFNILKFRTMYTNTPANVPTHMLDNPNVFITSVGRFLRKTSLDELPQLINIFIGDMSLVGPRPALYNQEDLISLREQVGVHKMRPGLTGWAQINGRDELEIPVKVEYDRYYVEHWSLWLDLKIIALTLVGVLKHKGVVEGRQSAELDVGHKGSST